MTRPLNVLSLFDGISAAHTALHLLGLPVTYFASEIDPDCLAVARKRYPNSYHLGDVCSLDPAFFGASPIDLLLGGSPCQNLTKASAGDRSGVHGNKSRLFFEFVRLKESLQPRYWLLENVASMSPKDRETISQYLGAQPRLLDAGALSAQSRKRLYWTNLPARPAPTPVDAVNLASVLEPRVPEKYYVAPALEQVYRLLQPGQNWRHLPADHPEKLRIIATRRKHADPGGMTGFWRVWDTQAKSPAVTASGIRQRMTRFVLRDPVTQRHRYPTPLECERLQGLPPGLTSGLPTDDRRYRVIGNSFSVPSICHLLWPLTQT